MRPVLAALIGAALLAPTLAAAEEPVVVIRQHLAAADMAREQADMWKRWAEDFSREMRASMGTMFADRTLGARTVKGAPYSAEIVTETNQALADGNTIKRRKTGLVYRDGEGRVRQETAAEGEERTVFITDPVAGKRTVLTPASKRAVTTSHREPRAVQHRDRQVVRIDGKEIRVEDGKVYIDGKLQPEGAAEVVAGKRVVRVDEGKITIDGKALDGEGRRTVVVKRIGPAESGDGTQREEVRVQVIRGPDDHPVPPVPPVPPTPPEAKGRAVPVPPTPPMPPMPGVQTMRFESTARLGKGVTTKLGPREFDGVRAEGTQTTWVIPAGEIGNRDPINITKETWYSPELQVTVYSRYHDPRTGETVYRLSGIRRGEPSPELFTIPADYNNRTRGR